MKNIILSIVILGLISVQCKNSKTVVLTQAERQLINTNSFIAEATPADFTISSVKLLDNIIEMTVNFTGEKGKHDFDLLWDGSTMKSMPPKVILTPVHKSENMSGRKKVEMKLTFNINTLTEKVNYPTFIIMIKNYPDNFTWNKE